MSPPFLEGMGTARRGTLSTPGGALLTLPKNCTRCFKPRPAQMAFGESRLGVCRGCAYQVEQLVNWLEAQGFGVQVVSFDTGEVVPTSETGIVAADLVRSTSQNGRVAEPPPTPPTEQAQEEAQDSTGRDSTSSLKGSPAKKS